MLPCSPLGGLALYLTPGYIDELLVKRLMSLGLYENW